jgi:hypothetical protein
MVHLLFLSKSLLRLAVEPVLICLLIAVSVMASHFLPAIKLYEERRVSDGFNQRLDAARAFLQSVQPDRNMQPSTSPNYEGTGWALLETP